MSLPLGGKFDLGRTWDQSDKHRQHRAGREVDLRTNSRSAAQLDFIWDTWEQMGGTVGDETGTTAPHYHLKYHGQ